VLDTPAELQRAILLGEDSRLELKAVRFRGATVVGPAQDDLADELAAMANSTVGGVCVLGVDDRTRAVEGVPIDRLDEVERLVQQACNDSVKPPLFVLILRMELADSSRELRPVLKVEVPRSPFVHQSPGGYLHRLGSSRRQLPPDLLARLFQQRSQALVMRFDEQPVPLTTPVDLDIDRARPFFPPADSDETALAKLLLVREAGGVLRCTVGGLLLFGRDPQRYLPHARLEAVRYRGLRRDANYQIDARTCSGTLEDQILAATAFVRANMRMGAIKTPARTELPQYDMRAVFEAVVNALVHRDYSIHVSHVRLFLFDDRLEIYSPGALPNSVTVDTMAVRQATRNELLVRFLSKAPIQHLGVPGRVFYVEARGEGVPLIIEESRQVAGRLPVWELFGDELRLTIYGRPLPGDPGETA
jgi:ATP-dependent DNA helicase RecG